MIVIIKRLFKFGDKFYKVGKYEAPELYQDHWFLESLIEQGFLTLASIAQKTAAVAKEIEKDEKRRWNRKREKKRFWTLLILSLAMATIAMAGSLYAPEIFDAKIF